MHLPDAGKVFVSGKDDDTQAACEVARDLVDLGFVDGRVVRGTLVDYAAFGWAVAVLTSFAHVYFPDTQHFAEVALQMLFFLTPIMYPPSLLEDNGMAQVTRFNPVARLVALVRIPVLTGQSPTLFQFSLATGLVAVVVALAILVLWRCERRLVFAL